MREQLHGGKRGAQNRYDVYQHRTKDHADHPVQQSGIRTLNPSDQPLFHLAHLRAKGGYFRTQFRAKGDYFCTQFRARLRNFTTEFTRQKRHILLCSDVRTLPALTNGVGNGFRLRLGKPGLTQLSRHFQSVNRHCLEM